MSNTHEFLVKTLDKYPNHNLLDLNVIMHISKLLLIDPADKNIKLLLVHRPFEDIMAIIQTLPWVMNIYKREADECTDDYVATFGDAKIDLMKSSELITSLIVKDPRHKKFEQEPVPNKDEIYPLIRELRQIGSSQGKVAFVDTHPILAAYKTDIVFLLTALNAYFDGNQQIPTLVFQERQFLHDYRLSKNQSLN